MVKVRVEQALPVLSPVCMFNDKVSEEDVRAIWLKRYGVAARSAHEVDQGMGEARGVHPKLPFSHPFS